MDSSQIRFGPVTRLLVRSFVDRDGKLEPELRRSAYAALEGWVSVVVNTLLFVVKLILGLMSGSIALMADAIHTISDSVTSVVVIISAKVARQPPDQEHPFGHGRAESIATVTVAMLLAVAGIEFGQSSIERLLHPAEIRAEWWLIGAVAATMLPKEWLARFAMALGRSSGNTTLEADGWHHRSDALSTVLVVISMIAGMYGFSLVDGIAGILISLVLLKVAYDIAKGAIDTLLGEAPSEEEIRGISAAAASVDGVRGVHDIVVHTYGQSRFVSLHIEVDAKLPATDLHHLAEQVEQRLEQPHGSVCVHVDPIDADHPLYEPILQIITEAVAEDSCATAFHDFRIFGSSERYTVAFDVTTDPENPLDPDVQGRLQDAVKARCDASRVFVEVDPRYSYTEDPKVKA